jgi:cyclase
MLKKRLIPCLVLRDGLIVQSIGFERYLPIGRPGIVIEFVTNWDVDEIVLLDITASAQRRKPDMAMIEMISRRCFVPLTVGGGISSIDDIQNVLHAGADKIAVNTAAIRNPSFIRESAAVFGSQCIVVSMDVKVNSKGRHEVMTDAGRTFSGLDPVDWARTVEGLGAGEIFLNSVDRDGKKSGYDLDVISRVSGAVSIPVIACGGVGKMADLADGVIQGHAAAVSAGNIFHYTEHSTIVAKAHLKKAGVDVRLNTSAKYDSFDFDELGRIVKREDASLEDLWFEKGKAKVI